MAEADNSWLFHDDFFIKNTPSRNSLKMPVQMELKQRESIYNFLIKLGSKLKLDGKTILAATIYVHRYYMRMPISLSKYYVASAAIAISCKLNDNYRQPDKISLVACNIKNPNPQRPIDEHSDMFWRWRDQLLFREELLLKTLNFELNLVLPYNLKDDLIKVKINDEFDAIAPDLYKNCLSLIEILSSFPILLSYDTYTLFGTAIIMSLYEKSKNVPPAFLEKNLSITANQCWDCYLYILRLLKYAKSDKNLKSNELAMKRVPNIDQDIFLKIGGIETPGTEGIKADEVAELPEVELERKRVKLGVLKPLQSKVEKLSLSELGNL